MVKKKTKSVKSSKQRDANQLEDVQVNIGLPPQVDGQLRCFCRVSVTQVTWTVPNTPDVTYVQLKWWGEAGNGILFRPLDTKTPNTSNAKTTARYPVRSGPKQFASYLNDMSCLLLDVLSGPMMVPIGTVEVPHISQLAPNRPVNGSYPVISPTEEKIGELHVSLMIEALMESYDSTGSIPTTDVSYTSAVTQESTYPKQSKPTPHTDHPRKPIDDPFISPASHMNNAETNVQSGYADDLRQILRYEVNGPDHRYQTVDDGSTVAITTNGDVVRTNSFTEGGKRNKENIVPQVKSTSSQPPGDLLSVLLNRGNKLREQMIVSALDSKSGKTQAQEPVAGPSTSLHSDPNMSKMSNDGSFLREILNSDKLGAYVGDDNLDEAAVDLVFGGPLMDEIKQLYGQGNMSLSEDDVMSDREDPIHSESILNELFYKNPASADDLSDLSCDETAVKRHRNLEDDANKRPPSRSSSITSLNLAFPEPEPKKTTPKTTPKRKSRVKLKRKGSKKRKGSRSRSRSRASASECSDSEALSTASTPRSESSRVSFDMVPSDIDEPPSYDIRSRHKKTSIDGLSVERLTLLGRVSVARVTIENLQMIGQDLDVSSSRLKPKKPSKYGVKPPKPSPKAKKPCTYFIEYHFPVVATSRDKYSPNAMATEVMRVVSRTVKNGTVSFNHRSVFPVMFDGTAVERWWKSALVFKVFSRTAGQKAPTLIGSCGIPLKSILKSESLYIGRELEVRQSDRLQNTSLNLSRPQEGLIGELKLVVELASDSKEFPTQLAKTKLAELTGKAKIVPIASQQVAAQPAPKPPLVPVVSQKSQRSESSQSAPRGIESQSRPKTPQMVTEASPHLSIPQPVSVQHYQGDQSVQQYHSINQNQPDVGEALTLHALLLIPDGRNITMTGAPSLVSAKRHPVFIQPSAVSAPGVRARDLSVRNTYLVCRMFWCDEAVHSNVCWGSSSPQFNFTQVAPVLLSQSLLERLKNNFMIIEVWDKKTSADNDKLVGIVKISLHQFYMSFRDKRICSALLKSQYPVIAVENHLPVVDPFSGSQYGQLNVLLAMGSAEQVALLTRMKTEGATAVSAPQRPQHYLERQDLLNQGETIPAQIGTESVVEHSFEIVVEGVRGLSLFEKMIWGEADCFIQYHFPTQQQTAPPGAPVIRHAVPTMKSFRTATTLCIADPTFHDVTRHRILLPQGTPVQRELLTACANSGGGAGNLPFELWCRFYHPNVRDQCIAKSSLPLAKLCAMITMQKRGEPSVQTFSFPLTHVQSDTEDDGRKSKTMNAGLIDVTIHYKTQVVQTEASTKAAANKNLSGAQVCISLGIIRACGLKSAAESVAQMDQGMQYPAEVGVNTYIRVKLSFLGSEGERITRTVARSFSPEFSHFMDFPCPLLWTEADTDAMCLAEILETAEAVLEVWHQVPGLSSDLDQQLQGLSADGVTGRQVVEKTGDVLLGSLTLPMVSLLSHRTGLSGWYPINVPVSNWKKSSEESKETDARLGASGLHRVGGGLELSVKFAHHDDRERVVHAARGVGWSPVDLDIEQDDWESEDEESNRYHHINITVDHVNFPLQNALIAGQNTLDQTAQCYIRYKFYDKAAVMSKYASLSVNNSGYISSQPRNKHDLQIPDSSTFKWYLREEKLEVQVWVTYGSRKGDEQRPKHRDKLIGSAYIAMETLSDPRRKQHRVSGMYPLFKPGSANLGGGYIRAHIAAKPQFGQKNQSECQEGLITLEGADIDADYDPDDSFHQITGHVTPQEAEPVVEGGNGREEEGEEEEGSFCVMIQVERACHLPLMKDKQKNQEYMPNTYVSYPTAEGSIQSYTIVFHNSDNPLWDHEHETKLSTDLLRQENKHLVFKVWHKPDGAPKSPDKLTDRVLGFVSVDLTPLASGMQQISGWYNIMDFSGQVKGQIKINVIPQESVISSPHRGGEGVMEHYPPSSSFLSLPAWGVAPGGGATSDGPFSLPALDLPHYTQHYNQVKQHHEHLQHQLQEHIQQFLRQQEETVGGACFQGPPLAPPPGQGVTNVSPSVTEAVSSAGNPALYQREPSIHWHPNMPQLHQEESSSRSYLFSTLRQQMRDLDDITTNLRTRLTIPSVSTPATTTMAHHSNIHGSSEFHIPVSRQHDQYPLTSTQSTISSYDQPRSQRETPRDDLASTGEPVIDSSRTAIDSGAFSVERSNEKYDDSAPQSNRSDRPGVTPRHMLITADSGINEDQSNNNSNCDELHLGLTLTPRESHERGDMYSESGGFNYNLSSKDGIYTPRDGSYTPRFSAQTPRDPSPRIENEQQTYDSQAGGTEESNDVTNVKSQDQKLMSIIQEHSEHDGSDSEDEAAGNKYYHQYRDMLSEEDNGDKYSEEEDEEEEEEEGEIVVPKRINDVSGKFSPTGEIIVLDPDFSQSVPYGKQTGQKPKSVRTEMREQTEDILQDVESDSDAEAVPRGNNFVLMTTKDDVTFNEKDSWLCDSDKEEQESDNVTSFQYMQTPNRRTKLIQHQRQDSDTGYSSRDNNSESYLTPSAAGTNSETDMSRLNEHESWEHRSSDDHVFQERLKNRLLSNVELESTGGSFGLKYDHGHHSRISSAGSRHTRKSSEPSISESYEREEEGEAEAGTLQGHLAEKPPLSARSEELNDFFAGSSDKAGSGRGTRSNSQASQRTYSDGVRTPREHDSNQQPGESGSEREEGNSREVTPRDRMTGNVVPNFFMPVKHLEESMRTLKVATDKPADPQQESERAAAASDMMARLTAKEKFSQPNTNNRRPTAEETKRIAKIFAAKF